MIDFVQVQNSVKELKKQLAANEIDEKTFEDRLFEMIDFAEDGYYWMFGHESEMWFRHDGQQWVPDDPSIVIPVLSQADADDGHDDSVDIEKLPVNTVWFTISLALIAAVGYIVYITNLA